MMHWDQLLTTRRYGHAELTPDEVGRSHFHKDHDRIIFSSAFRRLGRKTQVHPFALNDHIHTRLTHSMEVGSLGRSLGIRVGELIRSEEHTSELQSRPHLVCRLLLEKKKKMIFER